MQVLQGGGAAAPAAAGGDAQPAGASRGAGSRASTAGAQQEDRPANAGARGGRARAEGGRRAPPAAAAGAQGSFAASRRRRRDISSIDMRRVQLPPATTACSGSSPSFVAHRASTPCDGTDLTTLGLDLNSPECLYAAFASPWADKPSRAAQPPRKFCRRATTCSRRSSTWAIYKKFHLETLFYIFYAMLNDVLQVYAAEALHGRGWRYHKAHKLWFVQATQQKNCAARAGRRAAAHLL